MVFQTTIENGIAEMVLNHPPVNAFDSHGWFAIAKSIRSARTMTCA
jgi:enoyl-CoA hydratase